ncbi:N6-adenosine-methyltransferase subunit mettl3 [Sparganum proliferum]
MSARGDKRSAVAEELAAAKAKGDSIRERLAARRQQRKDRIASAASCPAVDPSATAAALLLARKMSASTAASLPKMPAVVLAPTSLPSSSAEAVVIAKADSPIAAESSSSSPPPPPTSVSEVSNCESPGDIQSSPKTLSATPAAAVCDRAPKRPNTQISEPYSKQAKQEAEENGPPSPPAQAAPPRLPSDSSVDNELESLLSAETAKEREVKRVNDEIMELLSTPSVMERVVTEKFKSQGGSQVQLFCLHGTRVDCLSHGNSQGCTKLHFRKIIHPHTDESLGDCSFLNTCFHVETCKYVHYEIDPADLTTDEAVAAAGAYNRGQLCPQTLGSSKRQTDQASENKSTAADDGSAGSKSIVPRCAPVTTAGDVPMYAPQWINCDIRQIDMTILGKFAVIMADPPWDIHMELPYGTMSDDEMRRMDIPCLQDDGYIFLWVTGRAMELGRECLSLWGYERCDEIIWVKTNQLQRLIRTGRTGHWLNHGKEHCLVGVKGNPQCMNKGLDCDVIVSEVRETSRKPDEIYGIIERLSPGTRKIELFGRPHNLQANWITLGNQLDGTYLIDPAVVDRYRKRYPNGTDCKAEKS